MGELTQSFQLPTDFESTTDSKTESKTESDSHLLDQHFVIPKTPSYNNKRSSNSLSSYVIPKKVKFSSTSPSLATNGKMSSSDQNKRKLDAPHPPINNTVTGNHRFPTAPNDLSPNDSSFPSTSSNSLPTPPITEPQRYQRKPYRARNSGVDDFNKKYSKKPEQSTTNTTPIHSHVTDTKFTLNDRYQRKAGRVRNPGDVHKVSAASNLAALDRNSGNSACASFSHSNDHAKGLKLPSNERYPKKPARVRSQGDSNMIVAMTTDQQTNSAANSIFELGARNRPPKVKLPPAATASDNGIPVSNQEEPATPTTGQNLRINPTSFSDHETITIVEDSPLSLPNDVAPRLRRHGNSSRAMSNNGAELDGLNVFNFRRDDPGRRPFARSQTTTTTPTGSSGGSSTTNLLSGGADSGLGILGGNGSPSGVSSGVIGSSGRVPSGMAARASRGHTSPQRSKIIPRHFGFRNKGKLPRSFQGDSTRRTPTNAAASRPRDNGSPELFVTTEESNDDETSHSDSETLRFSSRVRHNHPPHHHPLPPSVSRDHPSAGSSQTPAEEVSSTALAEESPSTRRRISSFPQLFPNQDWTDDNSDDTWNTTPPRMVSRGRRLGRGNRRVPLAAVASTPDPIAQVQQLEDDERFARMLQAEFDAEVVAQNGVVNLEEDDEQMNLHIELVLNGVDEEEEDEDEDGRETERDTTSGSSTSNSSDIEDHHHHHCGSPERPARPAARRPNTNITSTGNDASSRANEPPRAAMVTRSTAAAIRAPRNAARPLRPPPEAVQFRTQNFGGVRNRRGRHRAHADPVHPLSYHVNRLIHWTIGLDFTQGHHNDAHNTSADDYEVLWNLAETIGEVVPRGLNFHEINRLPTRTFTETVGPNNNGVGGASSSSSLLASENDAIGAGGGGRLQGNKECQVCLSDFETGEELRILPCFHDFHSNCIDRWLKNNNTCPVCRAEVKFE